MSQPSGKISKFSRKRPNEKNANSAKKMNIT